MGRRKIEIKPIKDDRNRSVTFLKRKGGLFKKAHELSVLCSVDVAVIIFGHNKKLHEYSSGDINELVGRFQYYAGAHEHKGPADFADKRGGDGDDDDDDEMDGHEGGGEERGTPDQHPMMQTPGMQNHPAFQNVRQGTPGRSPPIHNGSIPQFQRVPSPLPPGLSRPSSRTSQHPNQQPQHLRRSSSNLMPPGHPQHSQGLPPPGSYAYSPNPPFYNPQAAAAQAQMQQRPTAQATYPPPYPPHPPHPQHPQHPSMAQVVMQENKRQSGPPAFPPQQQVPPPQAQMQRNVSNDLLQPPPHHQAHPSPQMQQRLTPSPQPPQIGFASPPLPQPKPLPAHAKQHSIFTPIDDSRSLLAQHWVPSGVGDPVVKIEGGGPRSASIDIAAMQREKANGSSPRPPPRPMRSPQVPQRTASASSMPVLGPPTRSNTSQSEAKRPRLKVQIPSENSGDEAGTADSGDPSTSHPSNAPSHQHVVLPPPSPSANALLSAGAQGPPNPFARPAPPMSTNPHANNREANHIETPMSALPSRFMNDNLLPSPSSFYPEWGFGRSGDGNMLPSPLNFQTPVVAGQGWGGAGGQDGKRGAEEEAEGGVGKRARP